MKKVLVAASLALSLAFPAIAAAQVPNMVGTWKGQATAAHIGANPYRDTAGTGPNLSPNVLEFTFVIKEQQGNRFSGTSTSGARSETIIGSVATDGKTGVMLDDDGQYLMTIRDADTVGVCYFHTNASGRVVACYDLKRTP